MNVSSVDIREKEGRERVKTHSFLQVRTASRLGLCSWVLFALDRFPLAGFNVKVIDIVPLDFKFALVVVDVHWQPHVATFPNRVSVPLIRHVEIRCLFCTIDPP